MASVSMMLLYGKMTILGGTASLMNILRRVKRRFLPAKLTRIQKIKKYLIRKEDPTILEIGSYDFSHTLEFLNAFQDVTLYCFEPHPRALDLYKRRVGLDEKRCHLFNCAVGDRDGTATLRFAKRRTQAGVVDWLGSSSIKRTVDFSEQHPEIYFQGSATVELVRLDAWANEQDVGQIDFIWTDVQGAERDLIAGAENVLKRTKVIQLEFGETGPYPDDAMTRTQTVELMAQYGFVPFNKLCEATHSRGDLIFLNGQLQG